MRRSSGSGGFLLTFLLNAILNLEWTIPAWILLALHFVLGWSIKWFWIALGIWLLDILLWMSIFGTLNRLGNSKEPKKENKNPYSKKNSDFFNQE